MISKVASGRVLLAILLLLSWSALWAHGVDSRTGQFLQTHQGTAIGAFTYIGAKHMLTGYDHLLFLVGVIFYLYRLRDILLYVSLFTLGHSMTLLFGVLAAIKVNAYWVDAVIALSIVYKGFDNLNGFQTLWGKQPNTRWAVYIFGLFHGFGLATKLQDFHLPTDGLWKNLLAFNVGVEVGQFLALFVILIGLSFWRKHSSYVSFAVFSNTLLMTGGFILLGYQLTGYFVNG